MIINKKITAYFTGHRDLKPPAANLLQSFEPNLFTKHLQNEAAKAITLLYNEGYRYFLCGMAIGFDLLAGQAVIQLKHELPEIKLIAVVPFPDQSKAFSNIDRDLYSQILHSAKHTITICESYTTNCYHLRNDYLINNSSALISFFNGSKGGTAYTVKQAIKSGLRIINLV